MTIPRYLTAALWLLTAVAAFSPTTTTTRHPLHSVQSSSSFKLASAAANEDVCTIQILMSDTGGGHRASANALRDAFDVLHPGKIQCDIVDIFTDYGPFWPFTDYPAIYKIMAEYSFLWDWFYHLGASPFGIAVNEFLMELFCFDSFQECLARPSGSTNHRADMVISVHPLCQDVPLKILSSLDTNGQTRSPDARTTPFVTVVTDLGGAHPTWFNKGVNKCFVPTDALYQCARDRNVQPDQLVQYGLPIRRGFWDQASGKEQKTPVQLRQELGLDVELPTVLMVGGGDGMGGIVDIAAEVGDKLGSGSSTPAYQMVVVCGSNEKAKQALSSKQFGDGVKVNVQGFVNNMDEWMQASDAIVTKAGPGTIAEASICGLPCMLFSYLPGQEEGNVPFVENSGFGKFSGDPTVIAETVSSWLASPEKMNSLKEAALQAARPSATLDIAKDLADMVFAQKEKLRAKEPVKVGRA
ncbi:Monogalactosyldiacylglycerol synthase 2, chloroplastic [Seminavis robusta]|uniref:monogalactosyldiacylglycerol synthase n=1 Tax=Seminavis robusta TaxID=568900 RepID=A0A9N8HCZ7_9STRA|nr:Monogalactosyldiacylglycerol synthase 2, chloroplastic [Seminavis robusta]|eukprot:Sro323_g117190.1 Monogalactosyldiacylglycerol synthase 2, chloroplastic (469) ;mRNA; f:1217-2623